MKWSLLQDCSIAVGAPRRIWRRSCNEGRYLWTLRARETQKQIFDGPTGIQDVGTN